MEAKRSWFALVEQPATGGNEIHAIRPPGIGKLHAIIKSIDQCGKLDSQFSYARTGNRGALCFVSRAAKEHLVAHVGLHLPHIRGVSLKDVYGIEINLILILHSKLVQGGNLPPKWRSGVAPEYQYDRFRCPQGRQLYGCLCFQCLNAEVRNGVAYG